MQEAFFAVCLRLLVVLLSEGPDPGGQVHDLILINLDLSILVGSLIVPYNIAAQFAHYCDDLIVLSLVRGDNIAFIVDCLIIKIVVVFEF